tara:strand:+ start:180 stop:452 length:273 start_codon:yes stop_codon:yes gene_type:complete
MIVTYCVGGYPKTHNSAYWVIMHPAGTKRWCFTVNYRDEVVANFEKADALTDGLDFNVVSERTAFEIALMSVEGKSEFVGHKFDEDGNPV